MANTVKLNWVRLEVIKLQLFPFSLRDVTATWFDSLPVGSVNTWEGLVEAYKSGYFPPALTAKRRRNNCLQAGRRGESLQCMGEIQNIAEKMSYAWNRSDHSDGYFLSCYNYVSKGIIDASYYGAFKRRNAEEARKLIEDLAKCNYKAPSEASGSSSRLRGSGLIGLDRMTAIEAKLDVVMNKLRNNEKRMHTANKVEAVDKGESLQCMGEIQEIAEKMSYAWNRSYHSDGYFLSCYELCLQGYN